MYMRAALKYIVFSVMLAVSALSCGKRDKVIPRDEMAEIYAEMFVLDQKISREPDARRMADTLLVYEPVFEAHGYTSDDYRCSMAYYIKDPDRYVRILKRTVEILEDKRKELRAEKARLESLSHSDAVTASFRPERIFFLSGMANRDLLTVDSLVFYIDSTGGSFDFDVQKGYDTLYIGPRIEIPADTASLSFVPPDSGAVPEEDTGDTDVRKKIEGTGKREVEHVRTSVNAPLAPKKLDRLQMERK